MTDATNAPDAIRELKEWLADEGFYLVEEQPEFFGDRRLRWERNDLKIQASMDRGRWFVDVAPAWFTEWWGYGLEIVVDTLDNAKHFTHLLTLRDAVDIIEDRLDEIVVLLSSQEGCDLVEDKRRKRAHRWFGA